MHAFSSRKNLRIIVSSITKLHMLEVDSILKSEKTNFSKDWESIA